MSGPTLWAGPKGNGKTTAMLAWLVGGERAEGYPGWNRVLLVPSVTDVENVKPAFREMIMAKAESDDVETPEWSETDFSHRVFCLADWLDGAPRNPETTTEVAVDGLDRMRILIEEIPGQVVKVALWGEFDVRDPEQGMSMKELDEHAQAADERYRSIREAVRDLGLKPDRHRGVQEGIKLRRTDLERLARLYYIAAEYDWLHPGDEVLAPREEGSSGVAPYGLRLTKTELLAELEGLKRSIEGDDSFEGSFFYEMALDPESDEPVFLVQAALRIGNSMGQGGLRLLRAGLEKASAE